MLTALDAPESAFDEAEQNFVACIREHGWFRTNIFDDEDEPGFSYTTGYWLNAAQPELIMFGMKTAVHDVFWDLYRDAVAGVPLTIGKRTNGVFGNLPAYVFTVSKRFYENHLGWNRWFYAGDEFPCVQIVWPDREGVFPWEQGFDQAFAGRQVDLTEHGWAASARD